MIPITTDARLRRLACAASVACALFGMSARASADTAYGLVSGTQLITFDTATPGTVSAPVTITGLQSAETIVGIDIRPATGQLYGVGSTSRLYIIEPSTGAATVVSTTAFGVVLAGTGFGVDFNPTVDLLRVVSSTGQNFRLNVTTGQLAGVDPNLSPPGNVVASAYTNNFSGQLGASGTTLYGIDSASDRLVLQGGINQSPSPNTGLITPVGAVLGVDTSDAVGFDITATNSAFASLTVAGVPGLYTINLATGSATLVGTIGNGSLPVTGLAVRSPFQVTMYAVTPSNALISFLNVQPGTITGSVAISGLQVGETILGIDLRPATGQIYALGSTGRVYTIDVASGNALQIGTPLSVALNGSEFGVDFNPAVDRLRIVSNAEQNLRVHPDTGALVNVDTPLSPPGAVTGAAYTNNVPAAPTTTLFGIDADTDQLVRQGGPDGTPSPNGGVITSIGPLGVNTSAVLGFDITGIDGTAYAALNVDGLARLYRINLATGAAQLVGTIGSGAAIRGLTASPPARIQFSQPTYYYSEDAAAAFVTVTRQGPTVGPLSITLTMFDMSATGGGVDYTSTSQTTVLNGPQVTFQIPLTNDLLDEPTETLQMALTSPGLGNTIGTFGTAFLNIIDNDGPDQAPAVEITSPTTAPTFDARTPFVTLSGTASDDNGITSVSWFSNRGPFGTATGTTSWTASNVPLLPGANVIIVVATDTFGGSAVDLITFTENSLLYTLAEGATGDFFDLDVLLANPNSVPAPVTIDFLKVDGSTLTQVLTLPPLARITLAVDAIPGLEATEVSTNVTSTSGLPLVVERTMRWDATGYGAHTEKATAGPALTWYFAEGSQGFFDTFLLLSNPNDAANAATVQYLREDGTTVNATYPLTPLSRQTVSLGGNPALVNQSFGITVTFTVPGVAERAMYFGTPVFNGGHDSAGETAPATDWFLAEGATGSYFTTFVLLANPGGTDADVTLTYLPASGIPVEKSITLPANGRRTINLQGEDASLADAAVATRVQSSVPIVVERAQYWPGTPDQWFEAHNSFGVTALGMRWGLAEGRVGGDASAQTYVLLANPGPAEAAVTLQFLRAPGSSPQTVTKTVTVPPTSRVNVSVGPGTLVPELSDESFGALITSSMPIAVERAVYWNANGVVWAAGTNATATRLP